VRERGIERVGGNEDIERQGGETGWYGTERSREGETVRIEGERGDSESREGGRRSEIEVKYGDSGKERWIRVERARIVLREE
jgi:hypothetical protein